MNVMLVLGGFFSALAAILHIGCIYFGASWYRFFGAGEEMAIWAEQGSIKPTLITSGIIIVLSIWSFYAFSAANVIGKLPLLRIVMVFISGIYLCRGIAGFFLMKTPMGRTPEFWFWSSAICLFIGLLHAIGIFQQWQKL